MILRWASLGQWLDAMAAFRTPGFRGDTALDRARKGDPSRANTIDSVALDLEAVAGETYGRARSVAGGRVQVPTYLTGRPDHMVRRVRTMGGKRLDVYVSPMGSGLCDERMMLSRAAAILGAVSGLQAASISVDLYLLLDTQGSNAYAQSAYTTDGPQVDASLAAHPDDLVMSVVPLDSKPVDMAQLAGVLGHRDTLDDLFFPWAMATYGFTGAFARVYEESGRYGTPEATETYRNEVRKRLGLGPDAVLIPRVGHRDSQVWRDPIAWVQSEVKQALNTEEGRA